MPDQDKPQQQTDDSKAKLGDPEPKQKPIKGREWNEPKPKQ